MKQISSKLNIYVRDANIINNDIERITFRFIFWSFGILAFLYVFLLGNMVSNIVQRRNLEVDARALGNEVRNLELTYLSMSDNVDLTLSYSLGFKEAKTIFATRKSLGYGSINKTPHFKSLSESFGNIKMLQNDI